MWAGNVKQGSLFSPNLACKIGRGFVTVELKEGVDLDLDLLSVATTH